MNIQKSDIPSATGQTLRLLKWLPEQPKAIVQIIHGMAEHIDRYDHFAQFLVEHDFAVVGNNHAGHGETAKLKGYFAENDGWDKVIEDIHQVRLDMQREFPNIPYFMLGHSMGSFLLRTYIQKHAEGLQAAILSGTGQQTSVMLALGSAIANMQCILGGAQKPCKLLSSISNKQFSATIANHKTEFDWLSRDEELVARYIADEYCGFVFTARAYLDVFHGFRSIADEENYKHANKALPIYVISGENDPVGENGKMVRYVVDMMRGWGFEHITMKLYPEARHEILNEINKEEVYDDVLHYLEGQLKC